MGRRGVHHGVLQLQGAGRTDGLLVEDLLIGPVSLSQQVLQFLPLSSNVQFGDSENTIRPPQLDAICIYRRSKLTLKSFANVFQRHSDWFPNVSQSMGNSKVVWHVSWLGTATITRSGAT